MPARVTRRFGPEDLDARGLFLDLPRRLYSDREITQDRREEEGLLAGTHLLSGHADVTAFLVSEGDEPLARCVVTEYPGESAASFGLFECVDDPQAFGELMDHVEVFARDRGHERLDGPLDVSLWVGSRFKENLFDRPPYLGEHYSKSYYPAFFESRGYQAVRRYSSFHYSGLSTPTKGMDKARRRYERALGLGYEFRSPRKGEETEFLSDIYAMMTELYSGFVGYHEYSFEEFARYFGGIFSVADPPFVRIAYLSGEPKGFLICLPDYGNLRSRRRTPLTLASFLWRRRNAKEFVMPYLGVMPGSEGLGLALAYCVIQELLKRDASMIGGFVQDGNTNRSYGEEYITDTYRYVYLGKDL